jgi:hypothetical protein
MNKSRDVLLRNLSSLLLLLWLPLVISLCNNICVPWPGVNAFSVNVVTTANSHKLYYQHSNHNTILPSTRTSSLPLHLSSSISNEHDDTTTLNQPIRKVVFLLPSSTDTTAATTIPFQSCSTWEEAVQEIMKSTAADSTNNKNDEYNTSFQITSTQCQFFPQEEYEVVEQTCRNANVLIALGPTSPSDVKFVATMFRLRRTENDGGAATTDPQQQQQQQQQRYYQCQFALGGKPFAPLVGYYDAANPQPLWEDYVPFTKQAKSKQIATRMQTLFDQWTVQDFRDALLVFLNQ